MNDIVLPNLVTTNSQAQVKNPMSAGVKPVSVEKQIEAKKPAETNRQDLERAVIDLNEFVQKTQRELEFSIDDVTGSTIIKVTDKHSGEVIRQIPDVTLLELSKAAKESEVLNLIQITG